MADLDEIMSGRGEAMPDQTQQQPDEQPQPELQQPAQEQQPEQPQDDDGAPMVPRAALEDERAKRRKYTDELADVRRQFGEFQSQFTGFMQAFQAQQRPTQQPQPQQPAPDFFEAPDQYLAHQLQPVQQAIVEQREQFSRMMATEKFGEEAVNTAYSTIAQRINAGDRNAAFELQRIMSSPHPYGSLVNWHQQQATLQEIGSDPAAYKAKLRAEWEAEMGQQGQPAPSPQQGGQQPQAMPSSFTQTRSAGPRTTPQWSGPKPLSDIMNR
jgi:hypothetical protein